MPALLQKKYSIDISQKLYEKNTSKGNIAVYQTTSFGTILAMNEQIILSERDGFFYHEMISHPALFTHHAPQKIAIMGHCHGILQEVLKHSSVKEVWCITEDDVTDEIISQYFSELSAAKQDQRVTCHAGDPVKWLAESGHTDFDIIIQGSEPTHFLQDYYQACFRALQDGGMLVQSCQSALQYADTLKPMFEAIRQAGFHDWQTLNFPQPSYPSGWRTAMLATKQMASKRIREKDIYNRTFKTRYYNYDTHKAALALPEFMREEWSLQE